jgi:hypothetical protein
MRFSSKYLNAKRTRIDRPIAARARFSMIKFEGAYGMGSKPPLQKGLQRNRRLKPRKSPLRTPFFSMAWYMYTEHVGSNRHELGSQGETNRLYPLKTQRMNAFIRIFAAPGESG